MNGRDYFHHPEGDYWKRVSASVTESKGDVVKWQTVYNLLDSTGAAVLTETQNWSMRQKDGKYLLDLEWNGEAQTDVTIGKYNYGGLFVRMPWKEGIKGEVVNAARQKNEKAEGQAAMWVDSDHDGIADSRKVFMEGIAFPSAPAVGFDGVFIGAPPNLLFVPDKNKDDKADVEDIEVRLTGWGIRDRHETINSFHWGPDGWLYGLQGFATPSKVGKPVGKGKLYKHKDPFPEEILKDGVDINGGVWRYHPMKDKFEVVAHGFSNPWGVDYDAKGQLLMTACVIPHLWHVVPGGIYHRQGGQHFNPYVYSDIKTIAEHSSKFVIGRS